MCLRRIERLVDRLLSEPTIPTPDRLVEMAKHGDRDALGELSGMALGDNQGDIRKLVDSLDSELCRK